MSRLSKVGGLVASTLLLSASVAWAASLTLTSPNKFEPSSDLGDDQCQCTYFVDGYTYKCGWKIQFSRTTNRYGKDWPSLVTNATLSNTPKIGSVMCLGAFPGNPYGHVAVVQSVTQTKTGYTLGVIEANWPTKRGAAGVVNGRWKYYQHNWNVTTAGPLTAKIEDETSAVSVPVVGFLYPK
jgi:surface antigen